MGVDGSAEVVLIGDLEFGQVGRHDSWYLEREESVHAVEAVGAGKIAHQELRGTTSVRESGKEVDRPYFAQHASIGTIGRITLTILEAPGRQGRPIKVGREEPIPSGECDGIAQDGSGDRVARAEAGSDDARFGLLGEETGVLHHASE